jgi:hypothetical protein
MYRGISGPWYEIHLGGAQTGELKRGTQGHTDNLRIRVDAELAPLVLPLL